MTATTTLRVHPATRDKVNALARDEFGGEPASGCWQTARRSGSWRLTTAWPVTLSTGAITWLSSANGR
ncbi:MAG TPA: hypothetical protein VGG35_04135 [Streptosporangiaceae bacterium]